MITIDKNLKYQVYFQGFINSNNLKHGDTVRSYEYIPWIMDRHREFKEMKGLGENGFYTPELQKEFLEYIGGNIDGPSV